MSARPVPGYRLTVQELSDERPAPASFEHFLAQEHRGLQPLDLRRAV